MRGTLTTPVELADARVVSTRLLVRTAMTGCKQKIVSEHVKHSPLPVFWRQFQTKLVRTAFAEHYVQSELRVDLLLP